MLEAPALWGGGDFFSINKKKRIHLCARQKPSKLTHLHSRTRDNYLEGQKNEEATQFVEEARKMSAHNKSTAHKQLTYLRSARFAHRLFFGGAIV